MALFLFSAVFSAALLFARYEFGSIRRTLEHRARAELGRYFQSESISVVGLRGVRIRNFAAEVPLPRGPVLTINAPEVTILADVMDLLSGVLTVDAVRLEDAVIRVAGLSGADLLNAPDSNQADKPRTLPALRSFRVLGKNCTLEVTTPSNLPPVRLSKMNFDAYRLADSSDLHAQVKGMLPGEVEKPFEVRARFASADDFDAWLQCAGMSSSELDPFLPIPQSYATGTVKQPLLQAARRPGEPVAALLGLSFGNLKVKGQPDAIPPANGTLTARLQYDPAAQRLTLAALEVSSDQGKLTAWGSLEGMSKNAAVDARVEASQVPTAAILSYLLQGRANSYGTLQASLAEDTSLSGHLTGKLGAPEFSAQVTASAGDVAFDPAQKNWPKGKARLGHIEVSWDSKAKRPEGTLTILDGEVHHASSGVSATKLAGTIQLAGDDVTVYPLQADVNGGLCLTQGTYNTRTQQGELSLSGTLATIEKTKLATGIPNTTVGGSAQVQAHLVKSPEDVRIDAEVEATQTEIGYRWWFLKRPGTGAVGKVKLRLVPKKSLKVDADAHMAGCDFTSHAESAYRGGRWRLQRATTTSDSVDAVTLSRCLRLPYTVREGRAHDGHYEWNRRSTEELLWQATMGCKVDRLIIEGEGTEAPMEVRDLTVEAVLDKGAVPTGTVTLSAESGMMPPIRSQWFVPLQPPKELAEKYPPVFRTWNFRLAAKNLTTPPWKGTNFTGDGYTTAAEMGLRSYAAKVDGGRIKGTFVKDRSDNMMKTTADWTDVPANYFLEHLRLSPVLSGPVTGTVVYTMDKDDPGTLAGTSHFTVKDGEFSEEFLVSQFRDRDESNQDMLPPSLKFTRLEADVEFHRDVVRTPRLELASEGITVDGKGQFVTGGDMNYDIKVSLTPETAQRIPALRDNFNIQGHRIAQQNLELAFKVSGPTFRPEGRLYQVPPASVTLVSGALEVTSEALKVIDLPRKILVDLLKIGGGLVGPAR